MQNELIKSVIGEFVKNNKGIDSWPLLTGHLYSQGSIPERKLKNALKHISKVVNEEEILFFVDLSSFFSGQEGLVFTRDKLFWRTYWAEENDGMMEYAKINSVSIEGIIPANKKLVINSTKIDISLLSGKERRLIQELLMQITKKEKGRKREERKQKEKEKKRGEARDWIKSAESAIKRAKKFGCTVSEAEERLKNAELLFEKRAYEEIIEASKDIEKLVKKKKEEIKTEITINLSETSFKPNVWKKIDLTIKNSGTASAKKINVEYPEERVEIEGLKTIEELKPDEEKKLNIAFRPIQVGEVPLKVEISFKDFDNKEYKEEKTFGITVGDIIEKEEKQPASIEIKRGYEVLQNNDLRFGIRVINNTDYAIMDVETILDFPRTLFSMKGNEIQRLANIHPNGERTATYTLTPLGCIHNEKIDAIIFYKDHTGEKQTLQMRPKEVHCVCPFLKEKAMREGEFAELVDRCEYIQEGLSFSGISVNKIAEFIKESCAHRLYVISDHDIGTARIVNLAGESLGEKAYYLLTAVIQPHNNVTQVALRAYSDKPYGLHGFLTEIANSIRHLVSSVQSAKEIGVIESKQVITIIDSVVQRTSFGGTGEGPGATGITIEGSVVQRSAIGDGAENGKKCSHCGKDMSEDERFCPNCGTQMK